MTYQQAFRGASRRLSILSALSILSLAVGISCVLLPIYAPLGVIGCAAALLLWVLPDLQHTPERLAIKALPYFIYGSICLPIYTAIVIPGVPVLSLRRVAIYWFIGLTVLTFSVSSSVRRTFWKNLSSSKALRFFTMGYFAIIFASAAASVDPAATIAALLQSGLIWIVAFAWMVTWCDTSERQLHVVRALLFSAFICAVIGAIEFHQQSAFLWKLMPAYARSYFLQINPTLVMIDVGNFRDGVYRAISTFTTSLAWAQMTAMAMPIAAYFIAHGQRSSDRVLGVMGMALFPFALYFSGSRGGYVSAIVSVCAFVAAWAIRKNLHSRASIWGGFSLTLCSLAVGAVLFSVLFVPAVQIRVLGGGSTQGSNMGREEEWAVARPKILSRPWGYGFGTATNVVNYRSSPQLGASLDDYRINLLVDNGLPGFLLYYGSILAACLIGFLTYIRSNTIESSPSIACVTAIIAYATYSTALSQPDNIFIVFCLIGATFFSARLSKRKSRGTSGARDPEDPVLRTPVVTAELPDLTPAIRHLRR